MKINDFYLSLLIGIISGLIVSISNLVATCDLQKCTIQSFSIQIGILIFLSFILFIVFVKTFRYQKKKATKKMKKNNKIIALASLAVSFILIVAPMWYFLAKDTNFIEQGSKLLERKEQWIPKTITSLWVLGLVTFFIFTILYLRDWKVPLFFIFDWLKVISSFLLLLAILVPNFKTSYRIAFIFSSFAIYYTVYKVKESLSNLKRTKIRKP